MPMNDLPLLLDKVRWMVPYTLLYMYNVFDYGTTDYNHLAVINSFHAAHWGGTGLLVVEPVSVYQ